MDANIDSIARTIWGEFRSGGFRGMQAVCNVIMNRVAKQSWYGLTPEEVCNKNSKGVYQFDCNNSSDPNYAKCQAVTKDDAHFAMAIAIAKDALDGMLPDITDGSLNYYSTTVPLPSWAEGKVPSLTIGNTIFFNNID